MYIQDTFWVYIFSVNLIVYSGLKISDSNWKQKRNEFIICKILKVQLYIQRLLQNKLQASTTLAIIIISQLWFERLCYIAIRDSSLIRNNTTSHWFRFFEESRGNVSKSIMGLCIPVLYASIWITASFSALSSTLSPPQRNSESLP